MPRYLVTLRHAETGETQTLRVSGSDVEDAADMAEFYADVMDEAYGGKWKFDHACPADDEPVPFRDR